MPVGRPTNGWYGGQVQDKPILDLFGYFFFGWFDRLCFGLGRGPITSPGPAIVLMDRKDLNSNKTKQKDEPIADTRNIVRLLRKVDAEERWTERSWIHAALICAELNCQCADPIVFTLWRHKDAYRTIKTGLDTLDKNKYILLSLLISVETNKRINIQANCRSGQLSHHRNNRQV